MGSTQRDQARDSLFIVFLLPLLSFLRSAQVAPPFLSQEIRDSVVTATARTITPVDAVPRSVVETIPRTRGRQKANTLLLPILTDRPCSAPGTTYCIMITS